MRSIARRVVELDSEIALLDRQLTQLVTQAAPLTISRLAVSTGHAGTLLVTAGQNIDRLRHEASFAALCGASPIPVSVLRLSSFPRSALLSRHLLRSGRISAGGQTGPRRRMSGPQDARRNGRRKRPLSAEEKYQIWQQLLTGELTQRQAAEQWNVDPTTIMRIRRVGREGALSALAQSRPGVRAGQGGEDPELVAARAEIGRLEETVKEQAIELVALRGKTRSGW